MLQRKGEGLGNLRLWLRCQTRLVQCRLHLAPSRRALPRSHKPGTSSIPGLPVHGLQSERFDLLNYKACFVQPIFSFWQWPSGKWSLCKNPIQGHHNAQSANQYLDDCQAKRLLEGNIGEDATSCVGQSVDVGDVHLAVLLGVGNAAVQVMAVHQLQDLGQDLAAPCCHAVDVLTVALQDGAPIVSVHNL